jgi:hypothetical protein
VHQYRPDSVLFERGKPGSRNLTQRNPATIAAPIEG